MYCLDTSDDSVARLKAKRKYVSKARNEEKKEANCENYLAPVPKVETKLLQPFAGSLDPLGPVQFLRKLRPMKLAREIPDSVFIKKWVHPFLSSDALEWFTLNRSKFLTWNCFEEEFLLRFRSKNHNPNIMERLRALKQGSESYIKYHKKCLKLEFKNTKGYLLKC